MTRVPGISEQISVKLTPNQGSNLTLQLPKTNQLSIWVINKNTTDENSNCFHKNKKFLYRCCDFDYWMAHLVSVLILGDFEASRKIVLLRRGSRRI
jgi:hypothetical protein